MVWAVGAEVDRLFCIGRAGIRMGIQKWKQLIMWIVTIWCGLIWRWCNRLNDTSPKKQIQHTTISNHPKPTDRIFLFFNRHPVINSLHILLWGGVLFLSGGNEIIPSTTQDSGAAPNKGQRHYTEAELLDSHFPLMPDFFPTASDHFLGAPDFLPGVSDFFPPASDHFLAAPDLLQAAPDFFLGASDHFSGAPDFLQAAPDLLQAAPDFFPAVSEHFLAAPDFFPTVSDHFLGAPDFIRLYQWINKFELIFSRYHAETEESCFGMHPRNIKSMCFNKEDVGGVAAPILLSIYKRTIIAREEAQRPKQPPPPSDPFPPTEEAQRSKQSPAIYSLFTIHYPLIFFEQIQTQDCGFGRVETYGRTSLRRAGPHF